MATPKPNTVLHIEPLKQGRVTVRLIGQTPIYFNAMSAKTRRTLLLGGGKKTTAEKKLLKHDPEQEFRHSVYQTNDGPTRLCFPAPGIKSAMSTAALETPGVTKSSVQRLIFLPQQRVPVWGRPFLKMDVVRSADMNRTPDVRTRAYLPRWCISVDIAFVTSTLSVASVMALLANAGVVVGIGDFRQEKGRGSFGTFSVHGVNSMGDFQGLWDEITEEDRAVQDAALETPECADPDTEELMAMLHEERALRMAA